MGADTGPIMQQSLASLMSAIFLLEMGSGLQGILLPVRAEIAGFPAEMIGMLGTLYYLGFIIGCLRLPSMIRRIGHIRSFAALSAVAASVVLLHELLVHPVVWMLLRLATGFCFAGLFMVTESWLNDRVTSKTRGTALGKYMLATWLGVICGKLLYTIAMPETFHLFALVSIAVALSMVPLTVTNGAIPAIPRPARLRFAEVFKIAPISFLGCLAIGLANSAFWTFGPLFARNEIGMGAPVSLFMAACVLGGALVQWPLGRVSDRVDRRWVILALALISGGVGIVFALRPGGGPFAMYGFGLVFGAASLSLYALCVAYANDRADPDCYVDMSSCLLLVFGIGAVMGPVLAGFLVTTFGYPSLFLFTAGAEAFLAVVVLIRSLSSERVSPEERAAFAVQPPLSHGTQAVIELQSAAEPKADPLE